MAPWNGAPRPFALFHSLLGSKPSVLKRATSASNSLAFFISRTVVMPFITRLPGLLLNLVCFGSLATNDEILTVELLRYRIIRISVIVEAFAGFASVPSCHHQPFQQRWRSEAAFPELIEHHVGNVVRSIQTDKV